MKRYEILDSLAKTTGVNRQDTKKVYDAVFELIRQQLKTNEKISITGFGTFKIKHRDARQGIKPKTGEIIEIAPRNVVTFKPSVPLKKMINQKTPDR